MGILRGLNNIVSVKCRACNTYIFIHNNLIVYDALGNVLATAEMPMNSCCHGPYIPVREPQLLSHGTSTMRGTKQSNVTEWLDDHISLDSQGWLPCETTFQWKLKTRGKKRTMLKAGGRVFQAKGVAPQNAKNGNSLGASEAQSKGRVGVATESITECSRMRPERRLEHRPSRTQCHSSSLILVSAGHSGVVSWKVLILRARLKDDSDHSWENGLGKPKVEGSVSGRLQLYRHHYGSKRWGRLEAGPSW